MAIICNLMPKRYPIRDLTNSRRPARGIALVVVIVTMSIALTLFALWSRTIVQEHRRMAARQYQLQATRLAEAGVRRAMAVRAANPLYNEETWSISREDFAGPHAAAVRIRVGPVGETGRLRYEATAEFPAGATRRAQVTREIEIATTPSGTES
jgi:type II secretory pathway pseudopilin PulG